MENQKVALWAFAFYSVCYQALIWGLFGWAVFLNGNSGWWIVLAIMISESQYAPDRFGINQTTRTGNE